VFVRAIIAFAIMNTPFEIMKLPDDIIQKIFANFSPKQLAILSKVCKKFYGFSMIDYYWQNFYLYEKGIKEEKSIHYDIADPLRMLLNTKLSGKQDPVKKTSETWKDFYLRWKREEGTGNSVMDKVMSFLPANQVNKMAAVSHAHYDSSHNINMTLVDDESGWIVKCKETFGENARQMDGLSWKETYNVYETFPDQRPVMKRKGDPSDQNVNNNSSARQRTGMTVDEADVTMLCEISGMGVEEVRNMLIEAHGDSQKVLNFIYP